MMRLVCWAIGHKWPDKPELIKTGWLEWICARCGATKYTGQYNDEG